MPGTELELKNLNLPTPISLTGPLCVLNIITLIISIYITKLKANVETTREFQGKYFANIELLTLYF